MTARRGSGEGSVFFEASSKRWCAAIDLGVVNGKRRRIVRRRRTKNEALSELRQLQAMTERQEVIPDQRVTTAQYLLHWQNEVLPTRRDRVKESTARQYVSNINKHLTPRLGHIRLAELKPLHIQKMLSDMEREGLAPSTRKYALTVLSSALKYAVRHELLPRNPVQQVERPANSSRNASRGASAEDVRRLFDYTDTKREGPLFRLAFTSGMRRGEILALGWSDVDLDAGFARVTGTLKTRPKAEGPRYYIDQPKTPDAVRLVPLTASTVKHLRRWATTQKKERLRAGKAWQNNDLVFCTPLGIPMDPGRVTKQLGRFCDEADVPRMRFHDARHTAATLLVNEGVPIEVIKEVLGHSDVNLTSGVYAKIREKPLRDAAAIMEAAIGDP